MSQDLAILIKKCVEYILNKQSNIIRSKINNINNNSNFFESYSMDALPFVSFWEENKGRNCSFLKISLFLQLIIYLNYL